MKKNTEIPNNLRGVLWSRDTGSLDIERDKNYIIHQVLMFGKLSDIKWLILTYGLEKIKEVFLKEPLKIYTKKAVNFISVFILGITSQILDEQRYLKNTPRHIR